MNLLELKSGQVAKIVKISGVKELKKRLVDMGVIPGEHIKFQRNAPLGDPIHFVVKSTGIAIRLCDAENIVVELVESKDML